MLVVASSLLLPPPPLASQPNNLLDSAGHFIDSPLMRKVPASASESRPRPPGLTPARLHDTAAQGTPHAEFLRLLLLTLLQALSAHFAIRLRLPPSRRPLLRRLRPSAPPIHDYADLRLSLLLPASSAALTSAATTTTPPATSTAPLPHLHLRRRQATRLCHASRNRRPTHTPSTTPARNRVSCWPSRDPIEEWSGINLYGFVGNDGVDGWDYVGLQFVAGLPPGSGSTGVPGPQTPERRRAAIKYMFEAWYRRAKERVKDEKWLEKLKASNCPCQLPKCKEYVCVNESGSWSPAPRVYMWRETGELCEPDGWKFAGIKKPSQNAHPGGEFDVRQDVAPGAPGLQCIYDKDGKLITEPPGAGSADYSSPNSMDGILGHVNADFNPFEWAKELDGDPIHPRADGEYFQRYMEARPVNKGKDPSTGKPCPKNPQ